MANGCSEVARRVTLSTRIAMDRSTRTTRERPEKEGEPEGSRCQNLRRAAITRRADYSSKDVGIAAVIAQRESSFIFNKAVITH